MIKLIKRILIYSLVGLVITITPLYYIDNVILSGKNEIVEESPLKFIKGGKLDILKEVPDVPDKAQCLSVTYDMKHLIYIDENALIIKGMDNNRLIKTINDDAPIVYAISIDDRDIVMYFTYDRYLQKIFIKTYDIEKDEVTEHRSFSVKNFEEIKDVKYSSLTNLIYVNIQTGKGNYHRDNIYRVDIMKNISLYASNKKIDRMVLLKLQDKLIYQDSEDNVYISKKPVKHGNSNKFELIGLDADDNVYLSPINNPSELYTLTDLGLQLKNEIRDPKYSSVINKNNRVILTYGNSVYDVLKDKTINYEVKGDIIALFDGKIIYKNSENKIIVYSY